MIRRVALAYFTLYALASHVFLWAFPSPDGAAATPWAMVRLVTAMARVLGLGPLDLDPSSIDRRFDFLQAGLLVVLAVLAAGVWTLWQRPDPATDARVRAWFHAVLRWSLAAVLFGYGWVKVFPVQFPYPSLVRMMEPVGTLPLPTLLVTALGASPPFRVVIGLVEVAAAWLLLGPRTWRLGAPVALVTCLFVALLNLTYDITDKLFTLHLAVMAIAVAAPDMVNLARWLLGGSLPGTRPRVAVLAVRPGLRRAGMAALVIWAVYVNVVQARASFVEWREARDRAASPHVLRGVWASIDAAVADPWTFLVIDPPEAGAFRPDGTLILFEPEFDDAAGRLTLWRLDRPFGDRLASQAYRWTLAGDVLHLEGGGAARAFRRWDTRVLLLPQQQFRWIQERRARGQ